jgi:4-hydroxy-3-methylbut-2-en-1-yl diphosphate synthase IspG/GcpE
VSRREITLRVAECPYCGNSHSYIVEITLRAEPAAAETLIRAQVQVACAVDGRLFRIQADVAIGARQRFVSAQFTRFITAA